MVASRFNRTIEYCLRFIPQDFHSRKQPSEATNRLHCHSFFKSFSPLFFLVEQLVSVLFTLFQE